MLTASPGELEASEVRTTLRLGGPLALAEVGWMSTYLIDAIFVGRLPDGAQAIAASSLGNTIFYAIVFFGVGLLYGLDTLVSQAYGAKCPDRGLKALAQSLWLVLAWTPVTMILTMAAGPLLRWNHIDARLAADTMAYLGALQWSTLPLLLAMALRRYLQSVNRTVCVFVALVVANLTNILADWALLFGHLGCPALGLPGSGWATGLVRQSMLLVLVVAFAWHLYRDRIRLLPSMFVPSSVTLNALLRLGWAPAIGSMADLGVSTVQTLLCGQLGALALAANQVVMDVGAFVYMVPLGISSATSVRVGQFVGRHFRPGIGRATRVGAQLCVGFTLLAAAVFILQPKRLAGIYTLDPAVISITLSLFLVCAFYQPFDALEAALSGSLRGLGDTRTPMLAGVFWSWVIGLPLTWLLVKHYGVLGLWLARAIPAILTAINVALLWRRRESRLTASFAR